MTPFIKKKDTKKNWYLINAENVSVGRLAAYISKLLRGKNIKVISSIDLIEGELSTPTGIALLINFLNPGLKDLSNS